MRKSVGNARVERPLRRSSYGDHPARDGGAPVNGFNQPELLPVLIVLGIIAAIAIPWLGSTREKAYVTTMTANLHQLDSLQALHLVGHGRYATQLVELPFTPSEGVTVELGETDGSGWSAVATHAGIPDAKCVYPAATTFADTLLPPGDPQGVLCGR